MKRVLTLATTLTTFGKIALTRPFFRHRGSRTSNLSERKTMGCCPLRLAAALRFEDAQLVPTQVWYRWTCNLLIAMICIGAIGTRPVYAQETFPVNPQGSYLFVNTSGSVPDVVVPPLIVNLAEIGAPPGDSITLTAGGEVSYSCYPNLPPSATNCFYQPASLCALFSTSNVVNPPSLGINRVPGALMPVSSQVVSCVTSPTLFGDLPTDIPQDFVVNGSPTTIPQGAAYLIVAVPDTFYADNAGNPTLTVTPGTIILQENFDELTPALGVTSAGVFTAINGTNVDIVGGSLDGSLCVSPESGNCVDLDGTGGDSQGDIESGPITLNPGVQYTLSFDLIGSQRGVTTSTTVSFGPYSQTFVLASNDDTNGIVSVPITVPSTTLTYLQFQSNTPGEVGALLDNVLITTTATTQEKLTLTELGLGAGTVTDNSLPHPLINCSEANGIVTGTCSASYASGTTVVLTASPNSSPGFGGWGGVCTVTASNQCSVTMNAPQSVTASFVAPPTSVTLPFAPGTNVTQMATFCPNNSNPCTDPNGHALTLAIPQVSSSFPLTVLATEFYATGLCPAGGNGQSSDFDCRFVSFFNYGTDPTTGDTVVPLCYRYAHGNCVHYLVYSGTPGTEPPTTSYSGGVYWQIAFNNDTFTPPGPYWTGSTPRLLDDPDVNEFPGVPYGTNCSTPMTMNGSTTPPPIYCQFDADITTFFNASKGVDPTIGGKTPQANDVVVAFLPTSTGTDPVQTPATPTAPTIAGSCITGCASSGSSITFSQGLGGTFAVTAAGFPTPTLTESGTLPSGLTFNATTGLISGTPAVGSGGNYPITFTAANGVSPNATLSYTLALTIPTTTSVTASVNPSWEPAPVTFTATVAPLPPTIATPVGTVTFYDGAAVLATATLSSGTGAFSTSALSVGAHFISAVYHPNADFVASTSEPLEFHVLNALVAIPGVIQFGNVVLHTTAEEILTLENISANAVKIGAISITGVNGNLFSFKNSCPAEVGSNECNIAVFFHPNAAVSGEEGELNIVTSVPGVPSSVLQVLITGSGIK